MMKRTWLVLVAALCVSTQAWAFSQNFRIASASRDDTTCPGCSVVTEQPSPLAPIDVLKIPAGTSGGYGVIWTQVPYELTGWPAVVEFSNMSPDPSPSGNTCDRICAAAIAPGVSVLMAQFTCTNAAPFPMLAQWVINQPLGGTLTPLKTDLTSCAGTNCNGFLVGYKYEHLPQNLCASGSTNASEGIGFTVTYH